MTRTSAGFLGLVTIAPLTYLLFFTNFLIPRLSTAVAAGSGGYDRVLLVVFVCHATAVVVALLLVAVYVLYARRSRHVPSAERGKWVAALIIGNIFVMPLFWFLYVWKPAFTSRSRLTRA